MLGALAGLGVGFGRALAGLGVVLGVLLGVGFGRAGCAGWVGRGVGRRVWPCWAAVAGLGVVLGVGFGRAGRAGWVGRGFKVQKSTLEIQK